MNIAACAPGPETNDSGKKKLENDNLRDEYACLLPDVQQDIPFARIALQRKPEAINLWIGNSRSVTATHKDNFENIFVQISGRKHFVLLPPVCQPCMNERLLVPATYARQGQSLALRLDKDARFVPFATWDPERPDLSATNTSRFAKPIYVTLNPGDMLYLPAMW
jgi:jumonji domain-containing protein 7